MEEDPITILIFGRTALKTLNALIKRKNDTITCEVSNGKVVFEINKMAKKLIKRIRSIILRS